MFLALFFLFVGTRVDDPIAHRFDRRSLRRKHRVEDDSEADVEIIYSLTKETRRADNCKIMFIEGSVSIGGRGACRLFFRACEDLGSVFDHSFPAFAFFFFLQWRMDRAHKFHSLCLDQSTVAQRAETTVAECSLTNCV